MSLYFILFYEFVKVGLLAIGGGYATLPFLYYIGELHHWYTAKNLGEMLAIATMTPGPIGINLATFIGFKVAGIAGAVFVAAGIMLPSFIIVTLVAKLLRKFCNNFYVRSALVGLKPASCGMIAAVGFRLFQSSIIKTNDWHLLLKNVDYLALIILLILIIVSFKIKRNPIFYLGISALIGLSVYLVRLFFFGI